MTRAADRRYRGNGQLEFARCGRRAQAHRNSGAGVLYLPRYSPDMNPIEKAWAKLKQLLRAAKARTKEALDKAIDEALQLISRQGDSATTFNMHEGSKSGSIPVVNREILHLESVP